MAHRSNHRRRDHRRGLERARRGAGAGGTRGTHAAERGADRRRRSPAAGADAAFDGRASAVTLASRRMFEALELWPQLEPYAEAMREIIVTDAPLGAQSRPALLHFGEATADNQPAAWMVENRHLLGALHEAVSAAPEVTLRPRTKVEGIRVSAGRRPNCSWIMRGPFAGAAGGGGRRARIARPQGRAHRDRRLGLRPERYRHHGRARKRPRGPRRGAFPARRGRSQSCR
jgi:hypothetical protein